MLESAKVAARSAASTETRPPGRHRSAARVAGVALALTLIAAVAWPAPARAGDAHAARDGEPAAVTVTQALVNVGAWLLDLTGLGGDGGPPEGTAPDEEGIASAQAPMGPLIDPDGYAPQSPKPAGRSHGR